MTAQMLAAGRPSKGKREEGGSMRRRALVRGLVGVAVVTIGSAALAQSPGFGDFAGKWEGVSANGVKLDLDVEPTGKYSVSTSRGSDSGTAKMEAGQAVFPFTKNPGNIKLARKGESLDGTVTLGANTNAISFSRKK